MAFHTVGSPEFYASLGLDPNGQPTSDTSMSEGPVTNPDGSEGSWHAAGSPEFYASLGMEPPATGPVDHSSTLYSLAKNSLLSAGTGVTSGVELAGALANLAYPDLGETIRKTGKSWTDYLVSNMGEDWRNATNKSWLNGDAEKDPRSWANAILQSVPYLVATGGLGEAGALGLRAAGMGAEAATGTVAEQAAAAAARRAAGYTGAGALLGAGQGSQAVAEGADQAGVPVTRTASLIGAVPGAVAGAVLGRSTEALLGGAETKGFVQGALQVGGQALAAGGEQAAAALGGELGKADLGLDFNAANIAEAAVGGALTGAVVGGAVKGYRSIKGPKGENVDIGPHGTDAEKQAMAAAEANRLEELPKAGSEEEPQGELFPAAPRTPEPEVNLDATIYNDAEIKARAKVTKSVEKATAKFEEAKAELAAAGDKQATVDAIAKVSKAKDVVIRATEARDRLFKQHEAKYAKVVADTSGEGQLALFAPEQLPATPPITEKVGSQNAADNVELQGVTEHLTKNLPPPPPDTGSQPPAAQEALAKSIARSQRARAAAQARNKGAGVSAQGTTAPPPQGRSAASVGASAAERRAILLRQPPVVSPPEVPKDPAADQATPSPGTPSQPGAPPQMPPPPAGQTPPPQAQPAPSDTPVSERQPSQKKQPKEAAPAEPAAPAAPQVQPDVAIADQMREANPDVPPMEVQKTAALPASTLTPAEAADVTVQANAKTQPPPQAGSQPPPPPKTPRVREPKQKALKDQTPHERLNNLLAQGPQPVGKALAAVQDAFHAAENSPIFELMTRLQKAFVGSKDNPNKTMVVNAPMGSAFQGLYNPKTDTIYIDMAKAEDAPTTLMHEALHAAIHGKLRDPEYFKRMERLMQDFIESYDYYKWGPPKAEGVAAFNSLEEFIVNAMTNTAFQDDLQNLPGAAKDTELTAWQRFKNFVGIRNLGTQNSVAANRLFQVLMEFIPDGTWLQSGNREAWLAKANELGISAPMAQFMSINRSLLRNYKQPPVQQTTGRRPLKWLLPTYQLDWIKNSFGEVGRSYALKDGTRAKLQHDTINRYADLSAKREGYTTALHKQAGDVANVLNMAFQRGDQKFLTDLVFDSRMWSLHPDKGPGPTAENAYGYNLPGGPEALKNLSARWNDPRMTDDMKNAYYLMRDKATGDRATDINQSMLALVRGRHGAAAADKVEAFIDDPSRTNRSNYANVKLEHQRIMNTAEIQNIVGQLGLKPKAAAKLITELNHVYTTIGKEEGPYVPLRRTGSYYTVLKSAPITKLMTRNQLDIELHKDRTSGLGTMHILDYGKPTGKNSPVPVKYEHFYVSSHDHERQSEQDFLENKAKWDKAGLKYDDKLSKYGVNRYNQYDIVGLSNQSVSALRTAIENQIPGASGREVSDRILTYYLEKLPDTSVRKRQLHAEKIAGASRDLMHVFSQHALGVAYSASQMKFGHRLARIVGTEMKEDIANLQRANQFRQAIDLETIATEFKKRDEVNNSTFVRDDPNTAQKIWRFTPQIAAAYYLTGAGSILTNAMQVPMYAWPHLSATHGSVRAAMELTKAWATMLPKVGAEVTKQGIRAAGNLPSAVKSVIANRPAPSSHNPGEAFYESLTRNASKDEKAMLSDMASQKRIDFGISLDVRTAASRSGRAATVWDYLMDTVFIIPQAVETFNRTTTALASYRLNKAKFPNLTTDELHSLVANDLDRTQFNYAKYNKAPILKNEDLRAAAVFKTYPANVFYNLMHNMLNVVMPKRTAAERASSLKYLGFMTMATGSMAGLLGILSFVPLYAAALALTRGLTDDKDPEQALRKAMSSFSPEFTNTVLRGAPYGVGPADLGRLALPQTLPVNQIMRVANNPKQSYADYMGLIGEAWMGAPGGILKQMASGVAAFSNGQYAKGLEYITPKAFGMNDAIRAWDYANNGVTDARGYPMIPGKDISTGDWVTRTLGFEPSEIAQKKDIRDTFYQEKANRDAERNGLIANYSNAQMQRDWSARDKALAEIRKYNNNRVNTPITMQTLLTSVKSRMNDRNLVASQGVNTTSKADRRLLTNVEKRYG